MDHGWMHVMLLFIHDGTILSAILHIAPGRIHFGICRGSSLDFQMCLPNKGKQDECLITGFAHFPIKIFVI